MTGLTISTANLIDLLTDAMLTASTLTGGVYLAPQRAPWKDEPSDVDLLAAMSTTRYVLGHTWCPVDGQNLKPAVWPVGSTATALGVLKRLSKKGENHTVDIDMYKADPPENLKEGEHPGWIVTISESAALFDADTEFQFHAHHESRFPVASMSRMIWGHAKAPDDEGYVETPLTLWGANVLGPLVKVAKRNGGTMRFYRKPDARMQVVTIGPTWIGAAMPAGALAGEPTDGPAFDPVLPLLDPPVPAAAADEVVHTTETPKADQ